MVHPPQKSSRTKHKVEDFHSKKVDLTLIKKQ